jgi:serine/threonine-protein kinase
MASVYLARDWRKGAALPVVALKVMRQEFAADRSYVAMFLDESRILSRLDHPNLIRVIEAGVGQIDDEGQKGKLDETGAQSGIEEYRYIAMELLLGRTLADLWDLLAEQGKRMPMRVAAGIVARVGHGLHHAHALLGEDGQSYELVHRDVNPSNVFLTADGRVKLIDFGLARAKDTDRAGTQGVVTGKVTYLAPEQLTTRPSDRRTDIYQLGITLWEMVTGARLFLRDTQLESIAAVKRGDIPPPESLNPRVPPELSQIVLRALAHDPDRRFTSMAGFARALDRWVEAQGLVVEDEELVDLFDQVFPEERTRLDAWYRQVLSARATVSPERTIAPPAAVGGALRPSDPPPPDPVAQAVQDLPVSDTSTPTPSGRKSWWAWWKAKRA